MKKQIILFFLLFPVLAFADTIITSSLTSWGTEFSETRYILDSNVTVSERITVSGTVTLHLNAGCTLNAESGITVNYGQTLKIEGSGTINASGKNGAGIGGCGDNEVYNCGTVIINGGTINATTSDSYSAGIGGGGAHSNSNYTEKIIINGGTVTATGGSGGAGIGGGELSDLLYCEINGGKVIAKGGSGAAGIGGGDGSDWMGQYGGCRTVIINGGEVEATSGGGRAAAIGGSRGCGVGSACSRIEINGGKITVFSSNGTPIGSGEGGPPGTIVLNWTSPDDYLDMTGSSCPFIYDILTIKNDFRKADTGEDGMTVTKVTEENVAAIKKIVPLVYHSAVFLNGNYYLDVAPKEKTFYGSKLTEPVLPETAGYGFYGWYKDKVFTSEWLFESDLIKGDTILYAKILPSSIMVTTNVIYTWTGSPIDVKPFVTSFDGAMTLYPGTDYNWEVKNSEASTVSQIIDEGEYTLLVTGIGNYEGKTCRTVFSVEKNEEDDPNENGDPNGNTNQNENTDPDPNGNTETGDTYIAGNLTEAGDGTYYINMDGDGKTMTLDLKEKEKGFSFKLYDDGGKGGSYFTGADGNYKKNASGYLLITVAENYLIQLSGTVGTKTRYEYLTVYDGSTNSSPVLIDKAHGENNENAYLKTLIPVNSSTNQLLLYFKGSSSTSLGLDLTLSIVNKQTLTANADLYTEGFFYTSFYTDEENFMADSNNQVFYAEENQSGKLKLKKAENNVILKGQGVLLKSSSSQITLYATNQTANYQSKLKGTLLQTDVSSLQGIIYTLGISEKGGVGFYRATGSIEKGKAYFVEEEE